MRRQTRSWLVRRRLATQRLSGAALPSAADAVRLLMAVQCQDPSLAAVSLGMRTRHRTYAAVLAEQAEGGFVRTHILRPTWHYVVPEDLRWLLRLTSAKVESGLAARHLQLDLDGRTIGRGLDALVGLLEGSAPMTRKDIGPELARLGLPGPGERVGHLLLLAELRGVVCSGPPRGTEHTYALVDEVVPKGPDDDLDRDKALVRMVRRFFAGHGPAGERDLLRWSTLTLTDIRVALGLLGGVLESVEVDGSTVWFDPEVTARTSREHAAYLLPTFDEAHLAYAQIGFPRPAVPSERARLVAERGGGIVVVEGHDIGTFRRRVRGSDVDVVVRADHGWSTRQREAVAEAADRLGAFLERRARITWT